MSDSAPTDAVSVPDVWALDPESNPYLHNIFVLFGIDPDQPEKSVNQALRRGRKRVDASASDPLVVHDRKVEMTDVSQAEQVIRSPSEFVASRLLAHTRHDVDAQAFQEALKAIDAIPLEEVEDHLPLTVRSLAVIARHLPEQSDIQPDGESAFPRDQIQTIFEPDPREEQIFDL